jgi:hypothetical protein
VKTHIRNFLTFFIIQTICYSILTVNFRAVAEGRLAISLLSDGINASFAFFVVRKIAKSDDALSGFFGYVSGSLVGTALGMYISKGSL